jgi:hypothetical protein
MRRRFSGDGGWHDTCATILGLTKVDWNNNTLHKTLPVTLVYSSRFANVVKLSPELVDQEYSYRFFMSRAAPTLAVIHTVNADGLRQIPAKSLDALAVLWPPHSRPASRPCARSRASGAKVARTRPSESATALGSGLPAPTFGERASSHALAASKKDDYRSRARSLRRHVGRASRARFRGRPEAHPAPTPSFIAKNGSSSCSLRQVENLSAQVLSLGVLYGKHRAQLCMFRPRVLNASILHIHPRQQLFLLALHQSPQANLRYSRHSAA